MPHKAKRDFSAGPSDVPGDPELILNDEVFQPLPAVLTIAEVSQVLRVSRWTLYTQFIHTGKLKPMRIGTRRVVAASDVRDLIAQLQAEENA